MCKSKTLGVEFDTFEELKEACIAEIRLRENEALLDEDGYPTEAALEVISLWPENYAEWFKFIKSIWYIPDWGWTESIEDHEYKEGKVKRYSISTGGWSGNESIIRAMQDNEFMMWVLTWVSSKRGGHYVFESPTILNEETEADE